MKLSRRTLLRSGAAALAAPATAATRSALAGAARADDKDWRHGLSLFGDLKYPAGFKHFDYVNPKAPKGGMVRLGGFGTFDNFNIVIRGVKGTIAAGIDLIYDTLMVAALDEVSTEYGLLAEAVSHPADFSSVTYRLRAEAKWHDGKPVTPDDVIFSFEAFKKHHPQLLRLLPPRRRRRRRPASARSPSPSTVPATASCRRSSASSRAAEALVGRHRRVRQEARHVGDHARAAARQRRLPDQGVHRRPHHRATSA